MASFWGIVKYETRQLWRRRSFWVIQVLLLLPSPAIAYGPPLTGALALFYLVIPILVGPALLREAGKVGEIVWSSPTDALTHFSGVIAGLWLGLLPGTLLQLSGWFLADLFYPNSFSLWIWPASLAFLLLANTVGLFLTALLAMLVRRLIPLLFTWAVLWLWIFLDVIFSAALAEGFKPMQAMVFTNFFFHNLPLSPSLGLGLSSSRVCGMVAWFLGLGFLAVSLGLGMSLVADRRRAMRHLKILPVLILVGALAAVGGYALNARAAETYALHPSPYDPQIDAWEVDSQQTEVEVNVLTKRISGTSRLTLMPVGELKKPEVVLRLNPGLEATLVRDGMGGDLPTQRVGDSLVISLPAIPAGPIQLNLAWQGSPQISYLSFEQGWRFQDAPHPWEYTYMPAPLKALIIPQGGFLLRDGDWMPWPWSSKPHQAGQNSLTIRPVGGKAAAARPIESNAVTWNENLPKGLVVFLPSRQMTYGANILAVSPLVGSQHIARASLFAGAANRLAALFGEQPPRYVVVAPYLNELVWSGDLLLIPDGSGFYQSTQLWWVFQNDVLGPKQQQIERTAAYLLGRAWMHNRYAPPPLPFQPCLLPQGEDAPCEAVDSIEEIDENRWRQESGHWVQFAEVFDITTSWTPRANYTLNIPGEQSVIAFWLAMELADEDTRQEDLDLLAYFASVDQQLVGYGERYQMMANVLWPDIMHTRAARELIWDLHEWATRLGSEKATSMVIEVIQGSDTWNQKQILSELEMRSGILIGENR